MGHRLNLGNHHSRHEPILLLQVSLRLGWQCAFIWLNFYLEAVAHFGADRRSIDFFPRRPSLGEADAQRQDLRRPTKPWPIHYQGACAHHDHGGCRRWLSLCRKCSYFGILPISDAGQTDIVAVQRVYYNQIFSFSCE